MFKAFLIAAVMLFGLGPASAQQYPTHPVRLIVPFAPGGGTDALSRILADALSRRLGQAFVVENMGGAGGTIGYNLVARADPDGYTILSATPALVINPYLQKDIAYDPLRDFAPVIQTTTSPMVIVVPTSSPFHTAQDLIDAVRAKPGQIRYGSAGIGSISHVSGALFAAMAGVKLTHVPYRGSGPALIDLLAGRMHVQFENAPTVLGQIHGGQLRALAVGTTGKSSLLPGVPTIAETVPGYEFEFLVRHPGAGGNATPGDRPAERRAERHPERSGDGEDTGGPGRRTDRRHTRSLRHLPEGQGNRDENSRLGREPDATVGQGLRPWTPPRAERPLDPITFVGLLREGG